MRTDRLAWLALAALPLLAACEHDMADAGGPSTFGEANRQTMLAQVVDPDPQYESLVPPTSGRHAADAIDRYRNDKVKKPDRVKSNQINSGGGGSGGSGGGGS